MSQRFAEFSTDIVRSEYKNYYPTSTQNFNAPNKKIEFNIDYGDNFSMPKYQYYIALSFSKKTDGSAYGADDNIALVNNFVPFLFSRIEVRKHNHLIDEVEHPGVTSMVRSIVSNKQADEFALKTSGFEHGLTGGAKSKFFACGNLHYLGLGFFEDLNSPIYRGGFTISFIRDEDENCLYRWKTKKQDGTFDDITLPDEGKVTIDEFIIRVPMIEFKSTSKIKLIKHLADAQIMPFNFRKWQCIRKTDVAGSTLTFDITNTYRNIQNPTFIMVAFQTKSDKAQLRDASCFSHVNVKNIRVKINDAQYPEELQNFDIDNGNYTLAYEMLKDFKNVYSNNNDMIYSPEKFIAEKCVYVVDTSKQEENISNSKSNIIINVDFGKEVKSTDKVNMYVVVISQVSLAYDIVNSVIKEM